MVERIEEEKTSNFNWKSWLYVLVIALITCVSWIFLYANYPELRDMSIYYLLTEIVALIFIFAYAVSDRVAEYIDVLVWTDKSTPIVGSISKVTGFSSFSILLLIGVFVGFFFAFAPPTISGGPYTSINLPLPLGTYTLPAAVRPLSENPQTFLALSVGIFEIRFTRVLAAFVENLIWFALIFPTITKWIMFLLAIPIISGKMSIPDFLKQPTTILNRLKVSSFPVYISIFLIALTVSTIFTGAILIPTWHSDAYTNLCEQQGLSMADCVIPFTKIRNFGVLQDVLLTATGSLFVVDLVHVINNFFAPVNIAETMVQ